MLQKRIFDYEHQLVPQSVDSTFIHAGKIDTLYWVLNGGNLKTEQEIRNKIERYKEELLIYTNNVDMYYREKLARIAELEYVLSQNS
jgi:hypothetical protein